jgi:uncharacterized protein (DUF1800 family)
MTTVKLAHGLIRTAILSIAIVLAACGGGGGSSGSPSAGNPPPAQPPGGGNPPPGGGNLPPGSGNPPPDTSGLPKPTAAEAARFLTQATFGPNQANIDYLVQNGYGSWLDAHFAAPISTSFRGFTEIRRAQLQAMNPPQDWSPGTFLEGFWGSALVSSDQLRQRTAFALSQILVMSYANTTVDDYPRGIASYYDILVNNAFGNYRTLLEQVSLHPMMGIYLSALRNQKEDPARGRVPDENYAREIMQLFSIGLYQLNNDGTIKRNSNGVPLETYTHADIQGLAKVFTGWSWAGPDKSDNRFFGGNNPAAPDRDWQAMQSYPKYHSTSEKTFLGVTIPAQTTANPEASLRIALDTIFNHPNVGPFISQNLIQQLVTSNPSPAYVNRVANVFNNNGQGVRGDLKAVVRAILLDAEARDMSKIADPNFGKLREPVLRLTNWARAFGATSQTGNFTIGAPEDPATALSQTPMRAPSVFNYWRPGYVPPNSALGAANLKAPEMQITHEISVVGYLNYIRGAVQSGLGNTVNNARDVRATYTAELALADRSDALIDRVNLMLLYGTMSPALRTQIKTAVDSIAIPATNQTNIDNAKRNRVNMAVYLTLASPEFLAQR